MTDLKSRILSEISRAGFAWHSDDERKIIDAIMTALAKPASSPAGLDLPAIREALLFYTDDEDWRAYEEDIRASVFDRDSGSKLGRDKGRVAWDAVELIDAALSQSTSAGRVGE